MPHTSRGRLHALPRWYYEVGAGRGYFPGQFPVFHNMYLVFLYIFPFFIISIPFSFAFSPFLHKHPIFSCFPIFLHKHPFFFLTNAPFSSHTSRFILHLPIFLHMHPIFSHTFSFSFTDIPFSFSRFIFCFRDAMFGILSFGGPGTYKQGYISFFFRFIICFLLGVVLRMA